MLRSQTQWSATANSTEHINYLDSSETQSCRKAALSMSDICPCEFTVQEICQDKIIVEILTTSFRTQKIPRSNSTRIMCTV